MYVIVQYTHTSTVCERIQLNEFSMPFSMGWGLWGRCDLAVEVLFRTAPLRVGWEHGGGRPLEIGLTIDY